MGFFDFFQLKKKKRKKTKSDSSNEDPFAESSKNGNLF